MIKGKHLGTRTLDALAAESRPPGNAQTAHLLSCGFCRTELARLREVLLVLARRGEARRRRAPVDAALRGLRAVAPTPPHPAVKVREGDPGAISAAAVGLRAGEASRLWLYRAGSLEVDLQAFAEGSERWSLLGQIASPTVDAELTVHLRHDGQPAIVLPDARGRFTLIGVYGQAVELLVECATGVYAIALGCLPAAARGPEADGPQAGA